MVNGWRDVLTLLEKELRTEWRTREVVSAMGVFGVLTLLVFNFAFPPGTVNYRVLAPGILWVSWIFAGILGMNRSMAAEKEDGCLQGLLATPVDRGILFLGKFIANLLYLGLIEVVVLLLMSLFFTVDFSSSFLPLMIVTALGTLGFVTLGTFFAAIGVQTRYQEVLLPILLIPLVSPILIGAVKSTGLILAGQEFAAYAFWVKFLGAFDAIFLVVSFLMFEYVVEE